MQRLDEIQDLYTYDRWANARLLDAAGALSHDQFTHDLGSSFPSVRDTLVHILASDWVWLSRWQGVSPRGMPEEWARSTYAALRTRWSGFEKEQRAFLDGLTDSGLDEVISYRNTAGKPFAAPLWQLLRHVVNHATYHRGQVATMLRQLGIQPPSTDLVLFHRTPEADR